MAQVANRPVYSVFGYLHDGGGEGQSWGCGRTGGCEGAKFWMSVLTDLKQPRRGPMCSSWSATG